jgi:hypothetical protein
VQEVIEFHFEFCLVFQPKLVTAECGGGVRHLRFGAATNSRFGGDGDRVLPSFVITTVTAGQLLGDIELRDHHAVAAGFAVCFVGKPTSVFCVVVCHVFVFCVR